MALTSLSIRGGSKLWVSIFGGEVEELEPEEDEEGLVVEVDEEEEEGKEEFNISLKEFWKAGTISIVGVKAEDVVVFFLDAGVVVVVVIPVVELILFGQDLYNDLIISFFSFSLSFIRNCKSWMTCDKLICS
jgi:hypothetical protein